MKPDPCIVVRPSARVIARVDPAVAEAMAEAMAARPGRGAGASVGPIRRIVTPLIVCAALGATAATVPPVLAALSPKPVETIGEGHRADVGALLRGWPTPVPAPGSGLLFVTACLALAWLRRGTTSPSRRGVQRRRHVFSLKLARRVSPRAGRFFWRKR